MKEGGEGTFLANSGSAFSKCPGERRGGGGWCSGGVEEGGEGGI